MKKIHSPLLALPILFAILSTSCTHSSAPFDYDGNPQISTNTLASTLPTYSNSFDSEQIPNQWPNYGIGDPFVYRYNGTYYLYPSTSNRGVRGYKSTDLMQWQPITGEGLPDGYVLSPDYDQTIVAYAPEVVYYDGWFYMCESQAGNGHYFFKSRSPEGPFIPYTGNVGESIDGSFFIDKDGQPYFLRAKAETIRMTKFNRDFTLSNQAFDIENTSMGGWTEGPYMLNHNGNYYLTFTGVHVASAGYKVGYSYMSDSDTVFVRDGFTRGDNILINTDSQWHTLGHSSTTLGPDMDSYYIAYHSRTNGVPGRHFNLSRLLFNGTEMAVDRPALENTLVPPLPTFASHEPSLDLERVGDFLLSPIATSDTFTAEWNFIGAGGHYVFSYQDVNNYSYMTFDGNTITVRKVSTGTDTLIHAIDLDLTFDPMVLHTLRVSYRDGLFDLYFDNMQKLDDFDLPLLSGKIGYSGTSYEPHYTAFSNVAQGSSDQEYPKQQIMYAPSYDIQASSLDDSTFETITLPQETVDEFNGKANSELLHLRGDDHTTYRIYAPQDNTYQISIKVTRESQGKRLALKLDNDIPIELTLPTYNITTPFITLDLGTIDLTQGEHFLTLVRRQDISFVSLEMTETQLKNVGYSNMLTQNDGSLDIRGNGFDFSANGLSSRSDRSIAYVDATGYRDIDVSVTMTFNGSSSFYSSGIVIRADNDAYGQWDDINSLQGYYFGVKNTQAFLYRCDYQAMSRQLAINFADVASDVPHTLRVVAKGNQMTFYVDGIEEFSVIDANAYFNGRIGLYSTGASTTFKNLSIDLI